MRQRRKQNEQSAICNSDGRTTHDLQAKQLRQEEAVTKTLRLENDDLASELRDLYDKLAETQRPALRNGGVF